MKDPNLMVTGIKMTRRESGGGLWVTVLRVEGNLKLTLNVMTFIGPDQL